mmetsp:Transcript_77847/g.206637  ORF Transcript_77847/g.206637 Transcript_77847/m.206637 type:complete len:781 (-) Transcript_77847:109-2451(-)
MRSLLIFLGVSVSNGALEPRSWEEAQAMADMKLISMTAYERHLLMKGIGWTPNPAGPNLFPVLADGMYMGNAPGIARLGIPPLKLHDAGNGFRNNPMGGIKAYGSSTSFPSALALAATWDDALVARSAKAIGEEFKAKGANVILGPAVQVHRVQRNGRNFEYLSGEDPYLGARLAYAYVEAVQGAGVMGCAKHWAFNEQEVSRMDGSSEVDEKTAWEIYYPPFEATVNAGVGSFMCGYNKVNGTWDCENEKILKVDLKGKMGFNGFVMSDWFATHSASVKQGLDQMMPGVEPWFTHEVLECVEAGVGCERLQNPQPPTMMEQVMSRLSPPKDPNTTDAPGMYRDFTGRDAARRILAAIYRLRLEVSPGCNPGPECISQITMSVRSPSHDKVAQDGATQSVVLLKNTGTLPVDPKSVKKIFMAGWVDPDSVHEGMGMPPADYYSGGGSGHTSAEPWHVSKPVDAIRKRARQSGIDVKHQAVWGPFDHAKYMKSIREADLRIYVGCTTASEGDDRPTMFLDMFADQMIGYMAEAGPTVVLMQTPGAVVIPWRNHPNITAIMNLFLAGEKTGLAWASTLFGDVSPSGKLPIMLLKSHEGEVPPSQEKVIPYTEGMFGSYRSEKAAELAAYPFGHGLSYTTFGYGTPKQVALSECEKALHAWKGTSPLQACVTVEVTNTGERKGAEVAQAYVEFPAEARMPKIMLKGYHKTAVLEPGAKEVAKFAFTKRDLSTYDVASEKWVLHESVVLNVGSSSADFRGTLALSASGPQLPKEESKPKRTSEL